MAWTQSRKRVGVAIGLLGRQTPAFLDQFLDKPTRDAPKLARMSQADVIVAKSAHLFHERRTYGR